MNQHHNGPAPINRPAESGEAEFLPVRHPQTAGTQCLRDLKGCMNATLRMNPRPRFMLITDAAHWVLLRQLTQKHIRLVREMEKAFSAYAGEIVEEFATIRVGEKDMH